MMFEALSKGMYVPGAYEVYMQGMKNYPWLLPLALAIGLAAVGIIIFWAKKTRKC